MKKLGDLVDAEAIAVAREITGRFVSRGKGTFVHEANVSLGKKRSVLAVLVERKLIKQIGDMYYPGFSAFESETADLRNHARRCTGVVLEALKRLYSVKGTRKFAFSEVLPATKAVDPSMTPEMVNLGLMLALDFNQFAVGAAISGVDPLGEQDAVASITVVEGILDFESVEEAWQQQTKRIQEQHEALHSIGQIQSPGHVSAVSSAKEKEILSGIVSRFLNLLRGTPIQRTKIKLGPDRHLLARLVEDDYLRIQGDEYLPTDRAIQQMEPEIERTCRRNLDVALTALKNLYEREEKAPYSIARILAEVQRLDRTLDERDLIPALILAADFGFYSSYAGTPTGSETIQIDNISITENILDFHNVAEERQKRSARQEAVRERWRTPEIGTPQIVSSHTVPRVDFSFVSKAGLRTMIERDYAELQTVTSVRAVKARLILAGSLIEGLLLDALQRDEQKAQSSKKAESKPLDEWGLGSLIDVAVELGLIGTGAQSFGHAVREYRNLVHPGKELRSNYRVAPEEADIAERVLDIVIRDLGKRGKGAE